MSDFDRRLVDRMRDILGRDPTPSELEAGARTGPEITAMDIMRQRQALARGLSINRAPEGLPPSIVPIDNTQFDRHLPRQADSPIPGVSLSYNPMLPTSIPAAMPAAPPRPTLPDEMPPAPVPYAFPPPPTSDSIPAPVPPEVVEKTMAEKAAEALTKKGGDNDFTKGLDDISKGITPRVNPAVAAEAARISPTAVDPTAGLAAQAAQTMMAQLLQKRNRGLTLTRGPYG